MCWLTSHCAGGLGIWSALSEVVLAGSAGNFFLKGWAAGSWQAGLKAEGEVLLRGEVQRTHYSKHTTWQD